MELTLLQNHGIPRIYHDKFSYLYYSLGRHIDDGSEERTNLKRVLKWTLASARLGEKNTIYTSSVILERLGERQRALDLILTAGEDHAECLNLAGMLSLKEFTGHPSNEVEAIRLWEKAGSTGSRAS